MLLCRFFEEFEKFDLIIFNFERGTYSYTV